MKKNKILDSQTIKTALTAISSAAAVIAFIIIVPLKDRIDSLKEDIERRDFIIKELDKKIESFMGESNIVETQKYKEKDRALNGGKKSSLNEGVKPITKKESNKLNYIENNITVLTGLISQAEKIAGLDFKNTANLRAFADWRNNSLRTITSIKYALNLDHVEEFKNATAVNTADYPMINDKIINGNGILKKVKTYLIIKKSKV